MTNGEAVADLLNRLGQTSDDNDITYRLAAQWLDHARKELIQRYLERRGEDIPPSMIKRLKCVPIENEENCDDCPDMIINLGLTVYDLPGDIGVYQVLRPGGRPVYKISGPGEANMESRALFGRNRHRYYRIGSRLYLLGKYPTDIKFTIDVLPASVNDFEEEDPFPAPAEIEGAILDYAEKIGNRKLGRPHDITSDGKSLTTT